MVVLTESKSPLPACLSVTSLQQLTTLTSLCLAADEWHCQDTGRNFAMTAVTAALLSWDRLTLVCL